MAAGSGAIARFFAVFFLNPSLTRSVYQRAAPHQPECRRMPQTEYEIAVAKYLLTKSITRCPTVCVVPTQATIGESDRAAYRDYVAAKEAARVEKTKMLRHLVMPWVSPIV
jgi:hypothetical protein